MLELVAYLLLPLRHLLPPILPPSLVVEATVCPFVVPLLNELRPRIRYIPGCNVQSVLIAASGYSDVDTCLARHLAWAASVNF